MEVVRWIAAHWLDLLQSAGIVAGLFFTAYTIRQEGRSRRIGNYIAMADQHRNIWKQLYSRPELFRVLDGKADLKERPVSEQEHLFVNLLIVHLDGIHRAINEGMFVNLEGLRKDIQEFFSLPIPRAVWERAKTFQDPDFVKFVKSCWNNESGHKSDM